jgi:hypothetical protein
MKCSVENHQAAIKIKITGQNFWRSDGVCGAMKFHYASAAETGFVPQLWRNQRDEFVGDFYPGAPARPFVSGGGAKLAIIRPAAERTVFRPANCLN